MRFTEINLFGVYVAPISAKSPFYGVTSYRKRASRTPRRRPWFCLSANQT
jgi:hypothetical protein